MVKKIEISIEQNKLLFYYFYVHDHFPIVSHRASMSEIDVLIEQLSCSALDNDISTNVWWMGNAVCFGAGSGTVSFASIEMTSDMDGLSIAADSCTHKRPTWMHLNAWDLEFLSTILESSSSKLLSSFQSSQACKLKPSKD